MSSRRHPSAASNRSNVSCSRRKPEVRRASSSQLSLAAAARPASEANLSCNQRRCSLPRRVNPARAPTAASCSAVPEATELIWASRPSAACRSLVAAPRAARRSGGRAASTRSCSAIWPAELPVEGPGVAPRRQGRVGLPGQRVGHLFSRAPLVGQGAAVVDDGDPGGVPGVGGLAGTGLAGVAPVGVQGSAAEQVAGFPGAALRPVDRARPGVREVGRTVLAGAMHERLGRRHGFPAAVEADAEPGSLSTDGDRGR